MVPRDSTTSVAYEAEAVPRLLSLPERPLTALGNALRLSIVGIVTEHSTITADDIAFKLPKRGAAPYYALGVLQSAGMLQAAPSAERRRRTVEIAAEIGAETARILATQPPQLFAALASPIVRVAVAELLCARSEGARSVSVSTLSGQTGAHEDAVYRASLRLKSAGAVHVKRSRVRLTSRFARFCADLEQAR